MTPNKQDTQTDVNNSLSRLKNQLLAIVIVLRPNNLICLSDSVHSAAHSGTRSIDLCYTAAVSSTMKLVFHRKLGLSEDMEHQFHSAADSGSMV